MTVMDTPDDAPGSPIASVQSTEKNVVWVNGCVCTLLGPMLVGKGPDGRGNAKQEPAFDAVQEMMETPPRTTVLGDAVTETVGRGAVGETVRGTDGATGGPPEPPPHAAIANSDAATNIRCVFTMSPSRR